MSDTQLPTTNTPEGTSPVPQDDQQQAPTAPLVGDEAALAALEDETTGADNNVYHEISDDDDDIDAEERKRNTTYILEQQFENLKNLGFSENAIKKAYVSGCVDEKTATQWITMQLDHPELNTPLSADMGRVVIKKKVILTPEQRIAKIAELKAKIATKKAEAKQRAIDDERAAEKARIAGGKIAMELKEEMEARKRAQAYAEQQKEKQEELQAKEKIQLQLAIDKLMRKGKSSEEAEAIAKAEFQEMKRKKQEAADALMAERRAARAAAANAMLAGTPTTSSAPEAGNGGGGGSSWNLAAVLGEEQVAYSAAGGNVGGGGSTSSGAIGRSNDIEEVEPKDPLPSPTTEGFTALISKMRTSNPTGVVDTIAMLKTVVANILQTPMDQKKRYLKASNSHFKTKISSTPYALSFMKLLGFQVGWIELEPEYKGGPKRQEQTVVMNTVILRRLYAALAALESA